MQHPKSIRNKNDDFRKTFYDRHCVVCNRRGCDPCHIKSKGAGGPDEEWNIIPLCRIHHVEQHKIGIVTFAKKYQAVENWLLSYGWEIGQKLTRPMPSN